MSIFPLGVHYRPHCFNDVATDPSRSGVNLLRASFGMAFKVKLSPIPFSHFQSEYQLACLLKPWTENSAKDRLCHDRV
jgi:hypothetical protein